MPPSFITRSPATGRSVVVAATPDGFIVETVRRHHMDTRRYLSQGLRLERHRRPGSPLVNAAILAAGASLSTAVLFLSVKSSPAMSEIPWIPASLAGWADRNGDLRTAVPFIPLCLLAVLFLEARLKLKLGLSIRLGAAAGLTLLLSAETAQLWLPGRTFSPADLAWGAAGVFAGCVAAGLVSQFYRRGRGDAYLRLRNRIIGQRSRLAAQALSFVPPAAARFSRGWSTR